MIYTDSPICNSDPALAASAVEVDLRGLAPRAQAVWNYLEGAAYLYWTPARGYICTDEALDFDCPRWEGEDLRDFLTWLDAQYDAIFEED